MLNRNSLRSVIVLTLFSVVGFFVAASPAKADSVQITLNNLTFPSVSGPEYFNGSFLYDTVLNAITSTPNILATGATDGVLGGPLLFGGADITGLEPNQIAFDNGYSDFLSLNLPSGLSAPSYGFGDAILQPLGILSIFGFQPEYASSGSFSVSGGSVVTTPEPGSLLLLLAGLLLLGVSGFVFQRRLGPVGAQSKPSA